MKRVKVYIKGAYAPGNLGDDVLLLCMLNILKRYYAPSDIFVGLDYPKLGGKLDSQVKWISSKEPVIAELAIYGGGGQFFSFKRESKKSASLASRFRRIKKSISRQSGFFDSIVRVAFRFSGNGNSIFKSKKTAAFCVGVGPLDDSFANNKISKLLLGLDYISVRDKTSQLLCNNLGVGVSGCFTDPSLMKSLWWNKDVVFREKPDNYYSFVIRDWPYTEQGENKVDLMIRTARYLKELGKRVRMVSLFSERDRHLKHRSADLEWFEWDIEKTSIDDFIYDFMFGSKVIISSRAHGIWLPAALGVPAIAIPIENKLVEVASMLADGVLLSEANAPDELYREIELFENNKSKYRERLLEVINLRESEVAMAVRSFEEWLEGEIFI